MIISVSVVTGFQERVRDKVIGFGSHIQVTNFYDNSSMESSPVLIHQDFYPSIEETEPKVKQIQIFAYKPAILQASRDSVAFELSGKDTITSRRDILGVLFKGVDKDYDWSFLNNKLVEGRLINFDTLNREVLISRYISNIMGYEVGDQIDSYFIMDNGPKKRKFEICGIYDSGFEDFDRQFIFTQIHHIQKLNNWGVQTYLSLRKDTCINNMFVLKAITTGGSGYYKYKWNGDNIYSEKDYILVAGKFDEKIEVISSDFDREVYGLKTDENSIPDTARAHVVVNTPCECTPEILQDHPINFQSAEHIETPFGEVLITNGNGTHDKYTGGFEIFLHNWEDLDQMDEIIDLNIPVTLGTEKITERHTNIFSWLDLLDMNVIIIISLILLVSLINMVTSLLVMILEKTNLIGILKALGAPNSSIRKIFLINSMFLLSRGLLWGNILGVGLILIQYYSGIMTLDPQVYYLDAVPVNLDIMHIILINVLTVVVCMVVLILPSMLITKIQPIKAIRFD
ncbi:MAG: FtsX-like permease family protein [Crocinitomicaceae bacterium]|nr:FtsX-like permease family protein [Crocinitomicaceae bacterium]